MWKVVVMEARGAEKEKEAGETVEAEASAVRRHVQQPGEEGGEDYESMTYVSLSPRRSDHILFVLLPMVGS